MSDKLRELQIPFRHGLALRLVAHPGAWMPQGELEALVRDLHLVADASTSSGRLRYGVLSGCRARLADAVICVAYETASGTPVGFNATTLLTDESGGPASGHPGRVLHTGLCMIRDGYRSRGLCLAISAVAPLWVFARGGLRPLWITNVTQVPAAAAIFASGLKDTYPSAAPSAAPGDIHRAVARTVLGHRAVFGVASEATFDPSRFVIENAYTGGSDHLKKRLEDCPADRDGAFLALCRAELDYDRGDDLLQVGCLTLGHALRVVARFALRATGLRDLIPRTRRTRRHVQPLVPDTAPVPMGGAL